MARPVLGVRVFFLQCVYLSIQIYIYIYIYIHVYSSSTPSFLPIKVWGNSVCFSHLVTLVSRCNHIVRR